MPQTVINRLGSETSQNSDTHTHKRIRLSPMTPTDVLIIGGGPAGLSAALTLARQRHTAIVFDSGVYRNQLAHNMHMVLCHDGEDPSKYRAAAKANILKRYTTISFENAEIATVEKVEGEESLFKATDKDGNEWHGKKLILATGVRDIMLDIYGYKDNWAKSIYHCFFCKGYESSGAPSAGILATGDLANVAPALHFSRTAKRFVDTITIYTHGNTALKKQLLEEQNNNQIFRLDDREITRFEKGPGTTDIVLHFTDGESVTEGFLGHKARTEPKGDFYEQLGLEMTNSNDPKIHPMFNQASVRGVFIAGDGASPLKIVPQALYSGAQAGGAACAQLQAEECGQKSMF